MESCRCCLAEVSDLFYVFSTLNEFNMQIHELISNCGGILISEHDAYSKNICGSCLTDLTFAARFRERCLKANYILKSKLKHDEESDLVEPDDESVACIDLVKEEYIIGSSLVEDEESTTGEIKAGIKGHSDILVPDAPNALFLSDFRMSCLDTKSISLPTIVHSVAGENTADSCQMWRENVKHRQEYHPFPCDGCNKTFKHKATLIIHRRVHTGERPYQCRFCGKRFSQGGGLMHHERLHTGERPYRCKVCMKTFIQKIQLAKHSKNH